MGKRLRNKERKRDRELRESTYIGRKENKTYFETIVDGQPTKKYAAVMRGDAQSNLLRVAKKAWADNKMLDIVIHR
eukprot:UN13669